MTSSASFDLWVRDAIENQGYDRLWVTRNMSALEDRWRHDPSPMPPCPPAPEPRSRDRYAEL